MALFDLTQRSIILLCATRRRRKRQKRPRMTDLYRVEYEMLALDGKETKIEFRVSRRNKSKHTNCFWIDFSGFLRALYGSDNEVGVYLCNVLCHYGQIKKEGVAQHRRHLEISASQYPKEILNLAKNTCDCLSTLDVDLISLDVDGIWLPMQSFPYSRVFASFPPPGVDVSYFLSRTLYALRFNLEGMVNSVSPDTLPWMAQLVDLPKIVISKDEPTSCQVL